jgi:DNA-binding MarR family transcriptional regulator
LIVTSGTSAASLPANDDLTEIWMRMLPMFSDRHSALLELVRDLGLAPPHGFTLASLGFGPVKMRDLADAMGCDASYVTGIVDHLEQLGFAARRASTTDRRVKEIELTDTGRDVSERIRTMMTTPPAVLAGLSSDERAVLKKLLLKVLPEPEWPPNIFRPGRR